MVRDLDICFQHVLDNYPLVQIAHKVPRKELPVCQTLIQIANILEAVYQSKEFTTLKVKTSWGLGEWNPTPWVAFLDSRITTTTQKAFYPVFLFRADGSGFYLALDLGTGRQYGRPTKGEIVDLKTRAKRLSQYFDRLKPSGFSAIPLMDLRSNKGVGVGFAAGSIVHKFYPKETIPSSANLISDVDVLLQAYKEFCSSRVLMELFDLVAKGEGDLGLSRVNDIVRPRGKGQGFLMESGLREILEQYSMQKAIEYFQQRSYQVKDVHLYEPYDLRCVRGNETLMVEVKGTTSDGSDVLLTKGEVEHARIHASEATLFVCSEINLSMDSQGKLVAEGGRTIILRPWPILDSLLSPIGYFYHVPNGQVVKLDRPES